VRCVAHRVEERRDMTLGRGGTPECLLACPPGVLSSLRREGRGGGLPAVALGRRGAGGGAAGEVL
jgi:hypothetical protein